MNIFVDGKLAASVTGSKLAGFTTKQAVAWFVEAYEGLFPDADVEAKAEWSTESDGV